VSADLTDEFVSCRPALLRYLIGVVRSRTDAEDIAQETYVRLIGRRHTDDILSPKAFIFQVARNLTLDHLRGRKRREAALSQVDAIGQADYGPDDRLMARENLALLLNAILQLPHQCQRVYTLRKLYNMSHREIADQLGISVRTVENHIAKAVKDCRRYLEQQLGEPMSGNGAATKQRRPRS
jgi:RNA polymerase sigma-70 factor (ECF subfamily)